MISRITIGIGVAVVVLGIGAYAWMQTYSTKPTVDKLIEEEGRTSVVVTTPLLADVVKTITNDNVDVITLVASGVDPRVYRPSASDHLFMEDADVVFYHGLGFEVGMEDSLARSDIFFVDVSAGIDRDFLIPLDSDNPQSGYNPYIWHDVSMWEHVVKKVRDVLSDIDEDNAITYQNQASLYIQELGRLDGEVRDEIQSIAEEDRVLVMGDSSFAYFARAYGIEIVSPDGENEMPIFVGVMHPVYVDMVKANLDSLKNTLTS